MTLERLVYWLRFLLLLFLVQIWLLNVDDDADIYALHLVFTPLIQRHLDMFRSGWADRSERHCHISYVYWEDTEFDVS